ncbi:MAG TPA: SDR family oxidoreductase [Chitinophagales bacterium]|nr:SDR family oxidoreductase [Chitinophagales bacterium]
MNNKLVMITGAASGIGKATAELLHTQGYSLWLIDMNEAALKTMQQNLPNTQITVCNLADKKELEMLSEMITQKTQIDIVFLNAGIVLPGNFIDIPFEKSELQLNLNLYSTLYLNHVCGIKMKEQGKGHIINTVSMAGIIGLKGSAVYSACKFGLRGFLMAFRNEMRPFGVAVSGIYLSAVDTAMLRAEAADPKGTSLNFLSEPIEAEKVAKFVLKLLKTKKVEVYMPYIDSLTTKFLGAFPLLIPFIYPILEIIGERGRKKYIKKLNLLKS